MAIKFSTGLKSQMWNAVRGAVPATYSLEHGVIYCFTGSQPANADAAAIGTLLGKITVNGGPFAFGAPDNGLDYELSTDGMLYKSATEDWRFVGEADGTLGWFRFMGNATDNLGASTTLPRIDGRISLEGGGGEMPVALLNVTVGTVMSIDVLRLYFPATF